MAIPDFQTLMLPVLKVAAEGEQRISDVVTRLADDFGLSSEERSHLLPSGRQTTFANRVHWAMDLPGKSGERFSVYAASASKRHGLLY
ncbi:winged helix-turn-helix domain-containing protein, partial [Magnetospirillum sulfuroxidans]|nr:winged helix-turn-helix domain-containing protein [Magnetospirillum sulfuroxidans]